MNGKDRLLTEKEAAERLGLSPRTLQSWRGEGKGPVWKKLGRAVRYALNDLEAFLQQSTRASTSDPGPHPSRHRDRSRGAVREFALGDTTGKRNGKRRRRP